MSFRARKPFSVNISARANATLSRSQLSFLKLKTLLSIADCKGPNSPLNWCRFSSFSGEVGRAHLRCRFRLVHDPARELLRRSLHLRQYRQLLRLRGVSCALCSDSPPSTWLCSRYCLYPVTRVNRVQMNYKENKQKKRGDSSVGKRTFSCTTDEDDDEQLLAELGDFRWLLRSLPSGSGLLLPLSCLGRFRAFCTPIVSA